MGKFLYKLGASTIVGAFFMASLVACGGGGSTSSTTASAGGVGTAEENARSMFLLDASNQVANQIVFQLISAGFLSLQAQATDVPCTAGGSYSVEIGATTMDLIFTDCDFGCSVLNGEVPFDLIGGVTPFDLSITPDNGDPFTLGGSSTFVAPTTTFALTAELPGGSTVGIEGTTTLNDDNTANGALAVTADGEVITTCSLDSFNFGLASISSFSSVCGLDAPVCE